MQPLPSIGSLLQRDTRAWQFQVWTSFAVAVSLCAARSAGDAAAD